MQRISGMTSLTLLVVGVASALPAAAAQAETADRPIWYGEMDVGPRQFRFVVEEFEDEGGKITPRLISLDEGRQNFVLDKFELTDSTMVFRLQATKASFEGERSEDGRSVRGKWTQSNLEFDLNFRQLSAVPKDAPDEVWKGELKAPFQKLTMEIRAYRNSDGSESVFLDSVTQKAGGFKAIRTVKDDEWTVEIAVLQATFQGKVNQDKTEVAGTFTQRGVPLELTLKRVESPSAETLVPPNRPQTPKPPFPYDIEEVSFDSKADGVRIAGTLTIPKGNNSATAVAMITGSGPQDRDESIANHKPFAVIADHLSRHGIAVLRCDDRGTAKSTGIHDIATSTDFAVDIEAAFDFLREHPRIDRARIGLIGHSEGGLIAPMVAAKRTDVAFLVLLAGTGVNGEEILLSQGQLILKAAGINDEAALKSQAAVQKAIFRTVLEASDADSNQTLVEAATSELKASLPDQDSETEQMNAALKGGIERVNTPWFRFFLAHEPAAVLKKVRCPVLALNGGKDVQVDAGLNLPAIKAALNSGGNRQVETVEFPELNHLFQTSKTGAIDEYGEIEETISPEVLQRTSDWIQRVAK